MNVAARQRSEGHCATRIGEQPAAYGGICQRDGIQGVEIGRICADISGSNRPSGGIGGQSAGDRDRCEIYADALYDMSRADNVSNGYSARRQNIAVAGIDRADGHIPAVDINNIKRLYRSGDRDVTAGIQNDAVKHSARG